MPATDDEGCKATHYLVTYCKEQTPSSQGKTQQGIYQHDDVCIQ